MTSSEALAFVKRHGVVLQAARGPVLIEGKVTFVHRRLWPALVKLAGRFRKERLARVRDEHTASGAHRSKSEPFPEWVPLESVKAAEAMSVSEAEAIISPWLVFGRVKRRP